MDLDPKTILFKAKFAKRISDFLEQEEHFGNISEQEKETWYATLGKHFPTLRTRVRTKEQRRETVEQMKAQRLNGHAASKSVFNQLKDSLQCTKA